MSTCHQQHPHTQHSMLPLEDWGHGAEGEWRGASLASSSRSSSTGEARKTARSPRLLLGLERRRRQLLARPCAHASSSTQARLRSPAT